MTARLVSGSVRHRSSETSTLDPIRENLGCPTTVWYEAIMLNVHLPPELERFATACVDTGRYASVSDVTEAALRLLQQSEAQRGDFLTMLRAVEADGEAAGFIGVDEVDAKLRSVIADARQSR